MVPVDALCWDILHVDWMVRTHDLTSDTWDYFGGLQNHSAIQASQVVSTNVAFLQGHPRTSREKQQAQDTRQPRKRFNILPLIHCTK